ncbi:uncharacterized protein LOC141900319 isoform X2 [Tubulanus polymorphus]|uniref:uncharacterized protein LOC141900319 isoform X2 n=1 Tax=Tubulanus polymorphus TaxID=672921 RepID=UPI003DA3673F
MPATRYCIFCRTVVKSKRVSKNHKEHLKIHGSFDDKCTICGITSTEDNFLCLDFNSLKFGVRLNQKNIDVYKLNRFLVELKYSEESKIFSFTKYWPPPKAPVSTKQLKGPTHETTQHKKRLVDLPQGLTLKKTSINSQRPVSSPSSSNTDVIAASSRPRILISPFQITSNYQPGVESAGIGNRKRFFDKFVEGEIPATSPAKRMRLTKEFDETTMEMMEEEIVNLLVKISQKDAEIKSLQQSEEFEKLILTQKLRETKARIAHLESRLKPSDGKHSDT